MDRKELKDFLNEKVQVYNHTNFIESDPISIPHQFTIKENIEIAGFLAAIIAWGQRKSIIKNMNSMIKMMDNNPFEFVMQADETDLLHLSSFKHRTFNGEDLIFFIKSLRNIYTVHSGLEKVFVDGFNIEGTIDSALVYFRNVFFSIEHPARTQKHVANILKGAAGKRLNMFLRWMVRKDGSGVDFGIWDLPQSELMLPLDVHTGNISRKIGILNRKQNDWKAVLEVSSILREFDPNDPIKYDFALFGLGVFEKFN